MTITKMPKWKFLTNHALVLGEIAQHSQSTAREIALAIGVTERTALKIVGELDASGYIIRRRKGRRNVYRVNREIPLRHPVGKELLVRDLLKLLAPRRRHRIAKTSAAASDIARLRGMRRTA